MTTAVLDMKKMASDTTFHLHIKVRNMRWWQWRQWLVKRFADLMRVLLGCKDVTVELDYDYAP